MNEVVERHRLPIEPAALMERLRSHRLLGSAPREELEWLVAHGTPVRVPKGAHVSRKGDVLPQNPLMGMHIVLSGRMSHSTDTGGSWRKVLEWTAGDVAGTLPYSRAHLSPGNTLIEEDIETLLIPHALVGDLPRAAPHVTTVLVHVMLDRARTFKISDQQVEKMASLGKLAAGLAHELNNPASAAARSAQLLMDALAEGDKASRAVGAAGLTDSELQAVQEVRNWCFSNAATTVRTALERADREEAVTDWLVQHQIDDAFAAALAETEVSLASLDGLGRTLPADKLSAAIRWIAGGCTIRGLARDIERATTRVHELVSAVKGFTYMDHAATPEPVDVRKGLTDTLSVLAGKARSKGVSLIVDAAADLPKARGLGGELNQVWSNLIDNAIDAVGSDGRIAVSATSAGGKVVVKVTDNGPGVPAELKSRIFDPFFTTKPVGKGTGLGLDIVRRLVERNDGQIELESEPGNTVFRVTLPSA